MIWQVGLKFIYLSNLLRKFIFFFEKMYFKLKKGIKVGKNIVTPKIVNPMKVMPDGTKMMPGGKKITGMGL